MEGFPWRMKVGQWLRGSLVFLWCLVAVPVAQATLREVPEAGFAIDIPPWWSPVTPPPPQAALAVCSRKRERVLTIIPVKAGDDAAQAVSTILGNSRKWLVENGYTIADEKPLEQHGLKFSTLWAEGRGGASTAFWVTVRHGTAFVLRAEHQSRKIADDDELLSTLRSFHFMEAAAPQTAPGRLLLNPSGSIHWGRVLPPLITIGVLSLIFIVVLLAIRRTGPEKG